jgi:hypothetical protein
MTHLYGTTRMKLSLGPNQTEAKQLEIESVLYTNH